MAVISLIKNTLLRFIPEGVVFLGGFTMMAYEILAARVIAPYLGSSLYTWTSAIAAVLCGIIVGSRVGGYLADAYPTKKTLGGLCLATGVVSIICFLMAPVVGPWISMQAMPLWSLALIFCFMIFFPPACVSAMLTPTAIRTRLSSLEETGRIFGSLGAWNSAGSILGTYTTGFLLQAYVGTSVSWYGLSFLLMALGVVLLRRKHMV